MGKHDDTILDEVVEGLFGIFHNPWFWIFLLVVLGASYGYITKHNVLHILETLVNLVSAVISKF